MINGFLMHPLHGQKARSMETEMKRSIPIPFSYDRFRQFVAWRKNRQEERYRFFSFLMKEPFQDFTNYGRYMSQKSMLSPNSERHMVCLRVDRTYK